jgi:hypothetical protein
MTEATDITVWSHSRKVDLIERRAEGFPELAAPVDQAAELVGHMRDNIFWAIQPIPRTDLYRRMAVRPCSNGTYEEMSEVFFKSGTACRDEMIRRCAA